jgi:phosphoribosylformylglycinamidine cyclo-ligase
MFGCRSLILLDYIAYSKLGTDTLLNIVKGINTGCSQAGCALIGGETAQMPGMYESGDYDVAGFCVGVVEKNKIIDGSKIEVGDVVIGLESNGLHSNGFSLVRNVFSQKELKRMSNDLLKPTRIYVKPVLPLLRVTSYPSTTLGASELRVTIKGIAHITGGAFYDKIARILPHNVNVRINKDAWIVPKIFKLIQNKGNIEDKEMYHTFNMGVGMVLVVAPGSEKSVISKLSEFKLKAWIIGEVIKGKKEVEIA